MLARLSTWAVCTLLVISVGQVNAAHRNTQQLTGFADIAEQVKPSVVSVSVRIDGKGGLKDRPDGDFPLTPGDPFERFFRRFGIPPAAVVPSGARDQVSLFPQTAMP